MKTNFPGRQQAEAIGREGGRRGGGGTEENQEEESERRSQRGGVREGLQTCVLWSLVLGVQTPEDGRTVFLRWTSS
ncbi:hypothetical protein EYF80_065273 [Liparis tanakae]|uniref:Uncharacterized protein n=1 Tax=Liparis tanakae TaxID=230148 RepID=A0A4Z2E771_9TELE|nr:hypothetical protein EYF80_065273 [Liparis tanakae]